MIAGPYFWEIINRFEQRLYVTRVKQRTFGPEPVKQGEMTLPVGVLEIE
jgi:hypothetical protein